MTRAIVGATHYLHLHAAYLACLWTFEWLWFAPRLLPKDSAAHHVADPLLFFERELLSLALTRLHTSSND